MHEGNETLRRCPGDKCNHTFYYEPHATSERPHPRVPRGLCPAAPRGWEGRPAHDGNCAYVMQQEAARKAHQKSTTSGADPRPEHRRVDACGAHRPRPQVDENAASRRQFNEIMRKERQKGATKPCPKCKQAITKNPVRITRHVPAVASSRWSTGPYWTGLGGMLAARRRRRDRLAVRGLARHP